MPKVVPKVWGEEIWIVNCAEYCGKLLRINPGAQSSLHYHKKKKETFFCIEGTVCLHLDAVDHLMTYYSRPKTIKPRTPHFFVGLGCTPSVIMEVSTHHDDKDVVRLSESKPAPEEGWYNERNN